MTAALNAQAARPVPSAARRRVRVLVNRQAGTVLEAGENAFSQRLTDAFAAQDCDAEVTLVEPDALADTFARTSEEDGIDLIVVAGGDGTISGLLPLIEGVETPVAVLPLGTFNLIARDLGATGNLDVDVAAIVRGRPVAVDLVTMNGTPFHSSAGLGWFVTMAIERQQARRRFPFSKHLGIAVAAARTLFFSRSIDVQYETPEGHSALRADAVLVTNNRFAGAEWARGRLDEGVFELHVVSAPTVAARMRTIMALTRGTWRELDNITSITAQEAVLLRAGRPSGRVAMDGELRKMTYPLVFRIKPGAVRLVRCVPAAAEPAA